MFIAAKTKKGTSCFINTDYIVEMYHQSDGMYEVIMLQDENNQNDFSYTITAEDFSKIMSKKGWAQE